MTDVSRRTEIVDDRQSRGDAALGGSPAGDRLDSWKRIAAYLKRDVTTVQRWERRESMPVHRHQHEKQGSVYAFRSELDEWWAGRGARLHEGDEPPAPPESPEQEPIAAAPLPPAVRVSRVGRPLYWVLASLAVAAVLAAWWVFRSGYFWHDPLADAKVTRLTDMAGTEQAATISRDGRYAAFLSDRDGHPDVWLTEIGSNRYRNLTNGEVPQLGNPLIRNLGFSPDGGLVSMWTRQRDGSRPEDVSVLGAPTQGGPVVPYLAQAAEFDWSSDGTRLVFHTTAPGDPLFVRTAAGDTARQIYVAPAGIHCHFPVWSPDGEFIYFVRGEPPTDWDIWRLRPSGDGLERVTNHRSLVSHPVMLDAQTLVYLATGTDGSGPRLYAMDLRHQRTHPLSFGLERYTSLAASADGMRLVATVANSQADLWRVTIAASGPPQSSAIALRAASQGAGGPRFGPGFVIYVSRQAGRNGVWKLADGTATELWSDASADHLGAPAIAPDGRRIAFAVERRGTTQLYVINSDGSHPHPIGTALAVRGGLAWTPDSQSLIAAVVRDGEPRLSRIELDGSAPTTMASEYSMEPAWSPDGRFLVYSGADVGTTFPLRAVSSDGRPYALPTLILTRGARRVAFVHNSGLLIFLRGEIRHKNFWSIDPRSGVERQLTDLPADFALTDFDVSPDGTEIIFERAQASSNIALIERTR
jgi:Tol biopolymer transport system component